MRGFTWRPWRPGGAGYVTLVCFELAKSSHVYCRHSPTKTLVGSGVFKKMKILILMSLVVCLPLLALAQPKSSQSRKLFPYDYTIDDLPNGLRLVTVPTDYPNLVALYFVVQAGSRNEVEAGKTGFAHFFEHIMFRGSENYTADQREAIFKRAGAETNA